MKAQILGNLSLDVIQPKVRQSIKRSRVRSRVLLGEVEPIGLGRDHPCIKVLLDFGRMHGFKFKEVPLYGSAAFLPLDGSVPWHYDSGIGHLLCWLIDINSLGPSLGAANYTPALLSMHDRKIIELDGLRVGDVFVFNGDYGHAWLSNESCLLTQVTVSAPRATMKTA